MIGYGFRIDKRYWNVPETLRRHIILKPVKYHGPPLENQNVLPTDIHLNRFRKTECNTMTAATNKHEIIYLTVTAQRYILRGNAKQYYFRSWGRIENVEKPMRKQISSEFVRFYREETEKKNNEKRFSDERFGQWVKRRKTLSVTAIIIKLCYCYWNISYGFRGGFGWKANNAIFIILGIKN